MEEGKVTVMPQDTTIVASGTISNAELLLCEIEALVIDDDESYKLAVELGVENQKLLKTIENHFKPHKARAHETHSELCKDENKYKAPLLEGKIIWSVKVEAYDKKLRDEAAAKQAEIDKAARKQADDERKRLFAIAQIAQKSGNKEKAEEAKDQAVEVHATDYVPASVPVTQSSRPGGRSAVTRRSNWKATVIDLDTLIKAVIEDPSLKGCVVADTKFLNKFAKLNKNNRKVPGVRFKDEGSIAVRA